MNKSDLFSGITNYCDISKIESIKLNKSYSTVILLAAEHKDNVTPIQKYYDVNVDGTKNVLNQMENYNINNLIFTSSVAVYGLNKNNPNEDHIKEPFNHYGKSKLEAEKIIFNWYKKNKRNRSVTVIRPSVIFGENNRGNVFKLFKQIESGKFLMIGSGENKKSMAYVKNVVSFIKKCTFNRKPGHEVYNYTDYPDLSMKELFIIIKNNFNKKFLNISIPFKIALLIGYIFDFISFITKRKLEISSIRIKKFSSVTQFDSTKVHKVFKAPYTLTDGLNNTLNYEFKTH